MARVWHAAPNPGGRISGREPLTCANGVERATGIEPA